MTPQLRLYLAVTTIAFALVAAPVFASESKDPFSESGCEAPSYDMRSLTDEEQGQVKFSFLLDKEGTVVDAKVIRSSGSRRIDKESMRALLACRFQSQAAGWNNMSFAWSLKK